VKKLLPYILLLIVGASCTTYQEIGSRNIVPEQAIAKTVNYPVPANLETHTEVPKTQNRETTNNRIEVLSYSVAVAN
jgi:hypothetical protein